MADRCAHVDSGLLDRLTDLIVCSRCLRRGLRTRVAQVLSARHRPRSLCAACHAELAGEPRHRVVIPVARAQFPPDRSRPRP